MALFPKIILPAMLFVCCAGMVHADDEQVPAFGPLPISEFELTDFHGSVVLMDFWASWCKPCAQALPWLNAMQLKYKEKGLQVVMINLDKDAKAAAKISSEIDPGIRQFLDPAGELAAQYKLEGMPSSFLYDRSGELLSRHVGFLKADGPKREKAIEEALESEEP